jgi:molybdopterin-dependent oxidoreductase alpha subunit
MSHDKRPDGIRDYHEPAGGWGALRAVALTLKRQQVVAKGTITLLKANQPAGFDCPGCAWPDPDHTSAFDFCENGAKAISWESTAKRVTPAFFARHTVTELWAKPDYWLEGQGRLTHPMRYDAASDRFVAVEWDEAFADIAARLRALPDPNMAEFYTSGRASNEAAFLFQLLARAYGTNNFPDCSNMCHEPTSVGLPESIGIGKGTVSLADFDHCDLILSIGHNPGTNHPRMMTSLRDASRRGARIIVMNPFRERALERFEAPQEPVEMASFTSTPIAGQYLQVKIGGDAAALKGVMKAVLELDAKARATTGVPVLDDAFIAAHTHGFDEFKKDLEESDWGTIERASGLARAELEMVAAAYAEANATIVCYGMGITQHRSGTANVQQLTNLLLLKGNIGREGAGICPLRGHSNVQGDRTVGITEKPAADFLERLGKAFAFVPPSAHGHSVVDSIAAMGAGRSRAIVCLGGNLAVAAPDPEVTFNAFRKLDLAVHLATKLNRTHLLTAAGATYVLPVLGRTELDMQASGAQAVTVEDSMSMVHASQGFLPPPSEHVRSEPAIIAGIAKALLPAGRIDADWDALIGDYGLIRDKIEAVFPGFEGYNERIKKPGGFRMPLPPTERIWKTKSERANFIAFPGLEEDLDVKEPGVLRLATMRSHDQYNTTIYGLDDRYRGVFGRRDVLLMNEHDIERAGLAEGDLVEIETAFGSDERRIGGLTLVRYPLPPGCCGAYYPETQALVRLDHVDEPSRTPSYKSVPVRVSRASAAHTEGPVAITREGIVGRPHLEAR